MKILLKSLIVWLLLLAVPLQGFAAATMLLCAPLAATTMDAQHANRSPMQHDHAAMLKAQVSGEQDHVAMQHAAATSGDHATAGHHADAKCNSCAACGCGALMPPSCLAQIQLPAQHLQTSAYDAGPVPAVDLALPERPPQTSSV